MKKEKYFIRYGNDFTLEKLVNIFADINALHQGKNPIENAIIKARFYHGLGKTTIALDDGLFLDGILIIYNKVLISEELMVKD